jgi:hypothetical protein
MTTFDATLCDVQLCPDGSVLLTAYVPASNAAGLKRGDVVSVWRPDTVPDAAVSAAYDRLCEALDTITARDTHAAP